MCGYDSNSKESLEIGVVLGPVDDDCWKGKGNNWKNNQEPYERESMHA